MEINLDLSTCFLVMQPKRHCFWMCVIRWKKPDWFNLFKFILFQTQMALNDTTLYKVFCCLFDRKYIMQNTFFSAKEKGWNKYCKYFQNRNNHTLITKIKIFKILVFLYYCGLKRKASQQLYIPFTREIKIIFFLLCCFSAITELLNGTNSYNKIRTLQRATPISLSRQAVVL